MARAKQTLCKSVDELMMYYFPKVSADKKREDRKADEALCKTAGQEKASIKLRGKKQSNNVSLYLDQYTKEDGHSYEYLKMYLNIETTTAVKDVNRATMEVAGRILAERKDSLLLKGIGISKPVASKSLHAYIDELADRKLQERNVESAKNGEDEKQAEKRNKRSTYYVLKSLSKHLDLYAKNVTLRQVDLQFVRGFLDYLKTAKNFNFLRNQDESKNTNVYLSTNHQLHMYRAFNNMLNEAVRDGEIEVNPCSLIKRSEKPKEVTGTRNYLDVDEVKVLMDADCKTPEVKRAFLFCCFAGLRFSDVSTLTWNDIKTDKAGDMMLDKVMQKTGLEVKVPINKQASKWLGKRHDATGEDLIFELSDNETTNAQLKRWLQSAGISKKITFHCSRHTAATLALSLGCTPQSVMNLLGHTKMDMTLRYAKMVDEAMKNEVSKVDDAF